MISPVRLVFGNRRAPRVLLCGLAGAVLTVSCGGGGGGGSSDTGNDPAPSPVTVEDVREQMVAWFPIPIRDAPAVRNIRRPIPGYGWDPFVAYVVPILQHYNLKRLMLHNPFGRLSGEPYQFDQYLEAQDTAGLELATTTFVESWIANLLSPALGNGTEVIAYIGSPLLDPESQDILQQEGEQAFYERAWRAVDPFLKTGMSIGYDAGVVADKDTATYRFAEMLRARGTKVYAEANPSVDKPWWFDYPIIVLEETWQKRLDNPAFADHDELQGEVLRIVRVGRDWVESNPPEVWPEAMCRVIAEGDTLIAPDVLLRQANRRLEDLADCANALTAAARD